MTLQFGRFGLSSVADFYPYNTGSLLRWTEYHPSIHRLDDHGYQLPSSSYDQYHTINRIILHSFRSRLGYVTPDIIHPLPSSVSSATMPTHWQLRRLRFLNSVLPPRHVMYLPAL